MERSQLNESSQTKRNKKWCHEYNKFFPATVTMMDSAWGKKLSAVETIPIFFVS